METTNDEAIKALAKNISEQFPVSTEVVYRTIKDFIRYLALALQSSKDTGESASVVMGRVLHNTLIHLDKTE